MHAKVGSYRANAFGLHDGAAGARTADRVNYAPEYRGDNTGLRPARAVTVP